MFEKFNLLPLEIQRMIWTNAAFFETPQIIPFALTHPDDPTSKDCDTPWKHMFLSTQFKYPPLLHACQESRRIVQNSSAYVQGFELGCETWNSNCRVADEYDEHIFDCGYEMRLGAFSWDKIYWKPHLDVVYLREEPERKPCVPNSACNYTTPMPSVELSIEIDARVKYMAFDKSVWDGRKEFMDQDGVFEADGLEVCYIIVDKATFIEQSGLCTASDSQRFVDLMFERESRKLGRAFTAMMLEMTFHPGPISAGSRPSPEDRTEIEVKVVENLEQVVKDVEERSLYQARCAIRDEAFLKSVLSSSEELREVRSDFDSEFYDSDNSDDLWDI